MSDKLTIADGNIPKSTPSLGPSSFQKEMITLTIDNKVHSVSFMTNKEGLLKTFACVIALWPLGKAKPVSFIGTDMILERAFFIALEKYRGQ